jgi:hypothetical protein
MSFTCVIVIVIFRRKLYRSFPALTACSIFQLIKTTFLHMELALGIALLPYSYSSYPLKLCSIGFELWVVYEVFKTVFEPYDALRRSWR